jgi:NAD(P)-dependent dehydrogenase (short-subunit alcohol dehydrogenase family)
MNFVITGSSSGIGRALTAHLVANGHTVWGLARSAQTPVTAGSGNLHPFVCDVSDWTALQRTLSLISAQISSIDGLVTCAGIQGEIGPSLSIDPLKWSATVRTNLDGTFYSIRAFANMLLNSRRGKVVCLSGGGATNARANFSAYSVAKTAIVRLVENIAVEYKNLDINAVAPGAINTRLTDEVIRLGPQIVGQAEYDAAMKQKTTGGGSIERAVNLIDYLLSSKSDGISGKLISAPWDPWGTLDRHIAILTTTDIFNLRRILPEDRRHNFDQ